MSEAAAPAPDTAHETFPELDPKDFSFNSPKGWCPACRGHGRDDGRRSVRHCARRDVAPVLLVKDPPKKEVKDGERVLRAESAIAVAPAAPRS